MKGKEDFMLRKKADLLYLLLVLAMMLALTVWAIPT